MNNTLRKIQHFPFLVLKKSWPWQFEGKLVCSLLFYRAARGQGASQRGIAKATGLDYATVVARLGDLEQAGLARKEGGKWLGVQPQGDALGHFVLSPRPDKHWALNLQSYPIFLPSPKLSLRAAAVYSLLVNRGAKKNNVVTGTSYSHLAILLGLSPTTVKRVVVKLVDIGLVRLYHGNDKTRLAVLIRPFTEAHLAYFAEKITLKPEDYRGLSEAIAARDRQDTVRYSDADIEGIHQRLLAAKILPHLVKEIMDLFFRCSRESKTDVSEFLKLLTNKTRLARTRHATGQSVEHPGFLVRAALKKMLGIDGDGQWSDYETIAQKLGCKADDVAVVLKPARQLIGDMLTYGPGFVELVNSSLGTFVKAVFDLHKPTDLPSFQEAVSRYMQVCEERKRQQEAEKK